MKNPSAAVPTIYRWLSDDTQAAEKNQFTSASPSASDADLLDAYSKAVVGVVDAVGPAVVSVMGSRGGGEGGEPGGGAGSGFVITPDGFALTNSHVVGGRARVVVQTEEGDRLEARTVGDDPATDLALIRVDAGDLPTVEVADSAGLRVGQLVIAMGNPLGFQSTVSTGVVSAVGRSLRSYQGRMIDGVVQHTAPLNPGNSGGPLLDGRGRVVGVNTAIIAMAQGLGFAVPSGTARWVVGELLAHGRVRRAYLGVSAGAADVPRRLARALDLLGDQAVRVVGLDERGPAARAGVRVGDLVVALNDRLVTSVDDMHRVLAKAEAGREVRLTLVRGDRRLEVELVPAFDR